MPFVAATRAIGRAGLFTLSVLRASKPTADFFRELVREIYKIGARTLPIADHAVVIANGGIVFSGTPDALQASDDPLIRQFLDGEPDGPIPFESRAFSSAEVA